MRKNTLYISDLDGTLLSNEQVISDTTRTLINHIIAEGTLFSIATARTPATVSELLKGIDLRIPAVVMTGVALWDKNTGQYHEVQYFTPEQVNAVRETYEKTGEGAFLYTLKRNHDPKKEPPIQVYHVGEFTPEERNFMKARLSSPFKKFLIDEQNPGNVPDIIDDAVLFFGIRNTDRGRAAYEALSRLPDINPMYYHDFYGEAIAEVEAFPPGATKAKAVKRLARLVGADRIVVFGDNLNDISMMKIADWAVAMGNAVDEVKYVADEVINTNEADAVARFILAER